MSVTSERMKEQRKIKKLTQTSLAELVNSSRSSIAQIETDKYTPSYAMLSLIADALDTTVDYLQGKTDSPLKAPAVDNNGDENEPLTPNQRHIAYSIDPDVSDEEREDIIKMVQLAMKHRRRI
ncbi:helix-turn-helix transcriptional regulator [Leuconostoc falkenbergense]|uniref:Helix-turn-helix transcriptional regulator n=1 Tax=Leuconostoc falkenbergense TaxID=2766470 RepID=A0ABT7RWJ4_9LACO|nr:helix-turn-helix transcriptional regulator [Leuconostoc falkenbergense]MCT4390689.1 XRE family transcriptional regulator [Leuconostoc falkenbergense]MDM7645671.1 helix-turn-helix transcriptional regulator [Leuconostoc falkenbergense]MDY5164605.1 helix-turn-helix transcriptional regulator [Leuconostoc falkenbergense]